MNFKVKDVINFIKLELEHKGIRFKENDKNLIIECPICKYRDRKPNKIKLYISKEEDKPLIFHCFRCGTKGTIFKLSKILKQYYNINISQKFDIFEFIELNKNRILSKSLTNNAIGLAEYITNLKIEDILNYEFTIRVPKIQDYLLFSEKELNIIENEDKFILQDLQSFIKNGFQFNEYIQKERGIEFLLSPQFRFIKQLDYKVLYFPNSYLNKQKFRNRIVFLTSLNQKYFARLIDILEKNKNNQKRYLYPSLPEIDTTYKPLYQSDMFFFSLKNDILLSKLYENLLLKNTEIYLEHYKDSNSSIKELIIEKINKFINEITERKETITIENLYVFEGIFDGLKFIDLQIQTNSLNNFENSHFISVGGFHNFRLTLLFLRVLSFYLQIVNDDIKKLKIQNLIFIFDGDLDTDRQIKPITDFLYTNFFYFNKFRKEKLNDKDIFISDFIDNLEIENIRFIKFRYKNKKDIGELTPQEFNEIKNKIIF